MPHGRLVVQQSWDAPTSTLPKRLAAAFAESSARGLLHLATEDLQAGLPKTFEHVRSFACSYLATLLAVSRETTSSGELPPTPPPALAELTAWIMRTPPMTGLEYLREDTLAGWWNELDALVRQEIRQHPGGFQDYLSKKNPNWRFVGRVTFHLAENKRDAEHPFAFLATYASRLSTDGRVQHEVLGRSLEQYAGAKNRQALLALLVPIQRATERSTLVKGLFESGDIYQALAWRPQEAYRFLQDIPVFEESGLIVRVPDWWKPRQPPRPMVSVRIDGHNQASVGVGALLSFSVAVTLDGESLTEVELQEVLASMGGLVQLKGKWVEIDREKLAEALKHWQTVQRQAKDGLSFYEGMRLLSGVASQAGSLGDVSEATRAWTGLSAGPALEATLSRLRSPQALSSPPGLNATLRPYQQSGWGWLRFVTSLGLGACLADDMGLGKTVQVIALLLAVSRDTASKGPAAGKILPSLLIVPASLIANWKAEIDRFAPSLRYQVVHPSEPQFSKEAPSATVIDACDLVISTYGMLTRQPWLNERDWNLVILDEAQAIKNSGTRQTRAVKALRARGRIAMTGTPVENRLSDLWSLFDFLNPGLLGSAKAFANFVKHLEEREEASYGPLRTLVQPYILRRLKTDKKVIADLPDKTEVKTYCGLTKQQAALYEQAIRDFKDKLLESDGMQRRGLVLAQLMRLKQICNHPHQLLGHGAYEPALSGKFQRLAELCEELAQRQEKVLIFTQFREVTEPLACFLQGIFHRPGLVLTGSTAIGQRRKFVESFQRDDGPPFFVLSLKAGGTGLNLTEASHVIHFDRWWNPAVENQATDRAFRIGQKRNVLVHKFVCRGTVEERIDDMIARKVAISRDVVEGGERMLTEMANEELLQFVALDVHKALDS